MAQTDLELATEAAKAAGEILLDYWKRRESLEIKSKSAGDFVSQADLAAESFLRKTLLENNSADSWLGEETGASQGSGRRWIVDPLDGTTNFLRGIPHWAVSVALEVDGLVRIGVVHDPIKNETFSAEEGKGSRINQEPIRVSGNSDFSSALFGTGIPFGTLPYIDDHAGQIAAIMPHCAGVRRLGAAALDLAYVAAGRFDGYWERNLKLWDIAAGLVLVREAGATVSGWAGEISSERKGDVVVATPELFERFAGLIGAN